MKKILVTGATGFLGGYVINELLKQDIEIIATSRDEYKAKKQDWFARVKYIPGDVNSYQENWFKYYESPDMLLHLAWEGLSDYNDPIHFEKVLPNHYSFLKNLIVNGLKHLVVAGTCFEYGLKEGCLAEDIATAPCTCYGFAKDTLRKMLSFLTNDTETQYIWARLFYPYGEGQNPKSFVPLLTSAITRGDKEFNMSAGDQVRDYLPVAEVARKLTDLVLGTKYRGIYNICSGTPITILELANKIKSALNSEITLNTGYYPYPRYEPFAFWGDTRKFTGNEAE